MSLISNITTRVTKVRDFNHSTFTEMNHLGKQLITKPELIKPVFDQLFSTVKYSDNPLQSLLGGKSTMEVTQREWGWNMKVNTVRPSISLGNANPAMAFYGKMNLSFYLHLDVNYWLPGDVLYPGTSDKSWQVRVEEVAIPRPGTTAGFTYKVTPMWDDANKGLPAQLLNAGQVWVKLFSQYGEGSYQDGSTQFSGNIALNSRLSRYRKKYEVTGDVHNAVLEIDIQTADKKTAKTWIKYVELEYWEQWYRELERGRWYSRSTTKVLDHTGRPIFSGPGIQELLEESHIHKYSVLTARLIEEFIMDIFYSRKAPGSGRELKAFTGEYGMLAFHRAIEDWASQRSGFITLVDTNSNFINKESSKYHKNALAAGYQFTKYRMANGATLELIHNPLYDDRELHWENDPQTGHPKESQRITFLDLSGESSDGKGNVKLVNLKNGFKHGYKAGLTSPYGNNNGGLMAHEGDTYSVHTQDECGVQIDDLTRCGELILDVN